MRDAADARPGEAARGDRPAVQHGAGADHAATAFIVGVFYCLDALHGERRDRSILFWKSLPVSDRTTVLSKATIPLVVLPSIAFAIIVVAQLVMLVCEHVPCCWRRGMSPGRLWSELPLLPGPARSCSTA